MPAPTTFKAHSPRRCPMLNSNPGPAEQHPVLLLATIRSVLRDTSYSAEQRIERTRVLLRSLTITAPAPAPAEAARNVRDDSTPRGGLAPWQVKKLKVHILARIAFPITCAELAQTVRLSSSHFSRSFKTSLKETPHAFVLRTRIERSCALMRSTPAPALSDIAAECGFSDQAHFNRVFNRLRGLSPGRWRRLHAEPASPGPPAPIREI